MYCACNVSTISIAPI